MRVYPLFFLFLILGSSSAHAFHYYMDGGGGLGIAAGAQDFFAEENRIPRSSGVGLSLRLAGSVGLTSPKAMIPLYFGFQYRLESFSGGGAYHAAQILYPTLHVQLGRLYLGGGATPFLWKRIGESTGFADFNRTRGAVGMMLDGGWLFPITPEIAFLVGGSYQLLRHIGSPANILSGTVGFRVFGGSALFGGGQKGNPEYDGFRYPGGWERSD